MQNESAAVKQLFQTDGKVAIASENAKTGEVYLVLLVSRINQT